eukprot:10511285-Heterocapsa_arctica.AAC.1
MAVVKVKAHTPPGSRSSMGLSGRSTRQLMTMLTKGPSCQLRCIPLLSWLLQDVVGLGRSPLWWPSIWPGCMLRPQRWGMTPPVPGPGPDSSLTRQC